MVFFSSAFTFIQKVSVSEKPRWIDRVYRIKILLPMESKEKEDGCKVFHRLFIKVGNFVDLSLPHSQACSTTRHLLAPVLCVMNIIDVAGETREDRLRRQK